LDLADLKSVQDFSSRIADKHEQVDIAVLAAAIAGKPYKPSSQVSGPRGKFWCIRIPNTWLPYKPSSQVGGPREIRVVVYYTSQWLISLVYIQCFISQKVPKNTSNGIHA
jgi:hypothetical protein